MTRFGFTGPVKSKRVIKNLLVGAEVASGLKEMHSPQALWIAPLPRAQLAKCRKTRLLALGPS